MDAILEWLKTHQAWWWWLGAASLVMCVVMPLVAAWLVVRLPPDYFSAERRGKAAWWEKRPKLRPLVIVAKNACGIVLLVAGVLMLIAPGQGMLTMVAGVMLIDFPGKFRLERWLATRPAVWRSINWLRHRARREPLHRPG